MKDPFKEIMDTSYHVINEMTKFAEIKCEGNGEFDACERHKCAFSDIKNGCKLVSIREILGDEK